MITTMNSLSVAILSSICLVGCSPVPKSETLEVRDFKALVEGPQGAASTTFLGLFYCGFLTSYYEEDWLVTDGSRLLRLRGQPTSE